MGVSQVDEKTSAYKPLANPGFLDGPFRRSSQQTPRLLTPGPMALSDVVKQAMLKDLGSRGSEFIQLTEDVCSMLVEIAHGVGAHEPVLIQGSGTFAVEASIGTFCRKSGRVLVIVNGIYGERAVSILKRHGIPHKTVVFAANTRPDLGVIRQKLQTSPDVTHMFVVCCETTTGILNPLAELCALARNHGVTTIVDAMSSFGGHRIDVIRDHVDILISSGNKCVEAPPGIAFVIARRSLLEQAGGNNRSYCLDLHDQWVGFQRTGEWRSTPPTHVLQALHTALRTLRFETVAARRKRYERIRDRITSGMVALGFVPVVAHKDRSAVCIALTHPDWRGREEQEFARYCDALHAAGLHIYAKMHAQTASFRIGCIGRIQDHWIDDLLQVSKRHMAIEEADRL